MLRDISIKSAVGFLIALGTICTVSAQQPAPAQGRQGGQAQGQAQGRGGGGGGAARASALPLFFDVNWTRPSSQTGQTKVVQENIGDPNLELKQYGLHESCLLTSGNPGSETAPFSVWSGECGDSICLKGHGNGSRRLRVRVDDAPVEFLGVWLPEHPSCRFFGVGATAMVLQSSERDLGGCRPSPACSRLAAVRSPPPPRLPLDAPCGDGSLAERAGLRARGLPSRRRHEPHASQWVAEPARGVEIPGGAGDAKSPKPDATSGGRRPRKRRT